MIAPQLSTANRRDCLPADTRQGHNRRKKEAKLQASPCSLQVNVISSVTIDTAEYSPTGRAETEEVYTRSWQTDGLVQLHNHASHDGPSQSSDCKRGIGEVLHQLGLAVQELIMQHHDA